MLASFWAWKRAVRRKSKKRPSCSDVKRPDSFRRRFRSERLRSSRGKSSKLLT